MTVGRVPLLPHPRNEDNYRQRTERMTTGPITGTFTRFCTSCNQPRPIQGGKLEPKKTVKGKKKFTCRFCLRQQTEQPLGDQG